MHRYKNQEERQKHQVLVNADSTRIENTRSYDVGNNEVENTVQSMEYSITQVAEQEDQLMCDLSQDETSESIDDECSQQNRLAMTVQTYSIPAQDRRQLSMAVSTSSMESRTESERKRHRKKLADNEVTKLKRRSEMENLNNPRRLHHQKTVTTTTSSSSNLCDNISSVTTPTCLDGVDDNEDALSITSAQSCDRQAITLYKVKRLRTSSSRSFPTTDDMSEYMALPDIGSRATLDSGAYIERVQERTAVVDEAIHYPPAESDKGERHGLIKRARQWLDDYQTDAVACDVMSDTDEVLLDRASEVASTTSTQDNFCIEMMQKYNLPTKQDAAKSSASPKAHRTHDSSKRKYHFNDEENVKARYTLPEPNNVQDVSKTVGGSRESLSSEELFDEYQDITLGAATCSSEMLTGLATTELSASAVQAAVQATVQAAINISSSHDDTQSQVEPSSQEQHAVVTVLDTGENGQLTEENDAQEIHAAVAGALERTRLHDDGNKRKQKSVAGKESKKSKQTKVKEKRDKHHKKKQPRVEGISDDMADRELSQYLGQNVVQHVVDCVVPRYEQEPTPVQPPDYVENLTEQEATLRRAMCQCQASEKGGAMAVNVVTPTRGRSPLNTPLEWKEPRRHYGPPLSPRMGQRTPSRCTTPVHEITQRTSTHLQNKPREAWTEQVASPVLHRTEPRTPSRATNKPQRRMSPRTIEQRTEHRASPHLVEQRAQQRASPLIMDQRVQHKVSPLPKRRTISPQRRESRANTPMEQRPIAAGQMDNRVSPPRHEELETSRREAKHRYVLFRSTNQSREEQ